MEQWRKYLIDHCVKKYKECWPSEYRAICEMAWRTRKTRANPYAAHYHENKGTKAYDSNEFRWTLRLPRRLEEMFTDKYLQMNKEQTVMPDNERLCQDRDENIWFGKRYAEFRASEKI